MKLLRRMFSLSVAILMAALVDPAPLRAAAFTPNASYWQGTRDEGEAVLLLHEQVQHVAALAELYAAAHDGSYPSDVAQLMEMWPGTLLVNIFTLAATEPVDGAAASPGQIGYSEVTESGEVVAATITAFGKTSAVWTHTVGNVASKR